MTYQPSTPQMLHALVQIVTNDPYVFSGRRTFVAIFDDRHPQHVRYLSVESAARPTPNSDTFASVVRFRVTSRTVWMTLEQMPGVRMTIPLPIHPAAARGFFIQPPRRLPTGQTKVRWLSARLGYLVVKLAVGQVPSALTNEQVAMLVHLSTGYGPVLVESMPGGMRFVYVAWGHVNRIIRTMHRLCLFSRTGMVVFHRQYVIAPLNWAVQMRQGAAGQVPMPLMPVTVSVARVQ